MKRALAAAMLLLLWTLTARAQTVNQTVTQGDYTVHYAAFNSTSLTPAIAQQYGIARKAGNAVLLVNVQHHLADGRSVPAAASASGSVRDLMGERRPLVLDTAAGADASDLIAQFDSLDGEVLRFELNVLPLGAAAPIPVAFQQQFYADPVDCRVSRELSCVWQARPAVLQYVLVLVFIYIVYYLIRYKLKH